MRNHLNVPGTILLAIALSACTQIDLRKLDMNRMREAASNTRTATTEIDEKQEADIGREWASILVGAAPLMSDAAVQRYVNSVGRWLSLQSERPDLDWRFGVLESPNVNAFATPGGHIFITKGLLLRMHNEAELAGVLAHEIVHVVRKHHLKAIQKGAAISAGANFAAEFASQRTQNSAIADRLIGGIKEVMLRGLDKDDEFEADRMGVVIAARAGYDPFGLPAVLQLIQGMSAGSSELALLFETHPAPAARLDALDHVMSPRLEGYAGQQQVETRFSGTVLRKRQTK